MTIEYIVKGALGGGVSEVMYRVHADGEASRFEVLRDGEVSSSGPVPPDPLAGLESELDRLSGVPAVTQVRPPGAAASFSRKHKLVVGDPRASFCFLWWGDPPEQWLSLLEVVRAVIDISGGPAV